MAPSYCPDLNDYRANVAQTQGSHASNFRFNSLDDLVTNVQRGIDELNACARVITRTD